MDVPHQTPQMMKKLTHGKKLRSDLLTLSLVPAMSSALLWQCVSAVAAIQRAHHGMKQTTASVTLPQTSPKGYVWYFSSLKDEAINYIVTEIFPSATHAAGHS